MSALFILLVLVIFVAFYVGYARGQPRQEGVPPFPEVTLEKLVKDSWAIPLILFGLVFAVFWTVGESLFPAIGPPTTTYVVRTSNPWKGFKGINNGAGYRTNMHNRFL